MNTLMEPIRDREVEAQDQDQEVQAHMIHLYSFSLVLKMLPTIQSTTFPQS